jgi:peptidoglycan/LPS O-acetylase OafA/YrhL
MSFPKKLISLLHPPNNREIADIRKTKHFYSIDLLRGVSALVILVWHYHHFYYNHPINPGSAQPQITRTIQPLYDLLLPFYEHGFWAVQLFWIISGFVFAHVYAGRDTSAKDFAISRIARLYPLHFITLVTVGVLQVLSRELTGGSQIAATNDAYHFYLNLFFISHWGFQDAISFNIPIWSVSVEIAIYIVFFVVAKNIFSAGILFPLVLSGLGYAVVNYGTPLWFFAMCLMFFFIGVIVYYLLTRLKEYKNLILFLSFLSLLHFANMLLRGDVATKPFHNTEGFLLVPIVVIFGFIDLSGRFEKFFHRLKWIGDTAYSTYLWHFPIQVLVLTLVYYFSIDRSFFNSPLTLLAWILGMLAVGRLSFNYIEYPLRLATISWVKRNSGSPSHLNPIRRGEFPVSEINHPAAKGVYPVSTGGSVKTNSRHL